MYSTGIGGGRPAAQPPANSLQGQQVRDRTRGNILACQINDCVMLLHNDDAITTPNTWMQQLLPHCTPHLQHAVCAGHDAEHCGVHASGPASAAGSDAILQWYIAVWRGCAHGSKWSACLSATAAAAAIPAGASWVPGAAELPTAPWWHAAASAAAAAPDLSTAASAAISASSAAADAWASVAAAAPTTAAGGAAVSSAASSPAARFPAAHVSITAMERRERTHTQSSHISMQGRLQSTMHVSCNHLTAAACCCRPTGQGFAPPQGPRPPPHGAMGPGAGAPPAAGRHAFGGGPPQHHGGRGRGARGSFGRGRGRPAGGRVMLVNGGRGMPVASGGPLVRGGRFAGGPAGRGAPAGGAVQVWTWPAGLREITLVSAFAACHRLTRLRKIRDKHFSDG
jgi:hypothetical protein